MVAFTAILLYRSSSSLGVYTPCCQLFPSFLFTAITYYSRVRPNYMYLEILPTTRKKHRPPYQRTNSCESGAVFFPALPRNENTHRTTIPPVPILLDHVFVFVLAHLLRSCSRSATTHPHPIHVNTSVCAGIQRLSLLLPRNMVCTMRPTHMCTLCTCGLQQKEE